MKKILLTFVIFASGVVLLITFLSRNRTDVQESVTPSEVAADEQRITDQPRSPEVRELEVPAEDVAPFISRSEPSHEVIATRQMVKAHITLRQSAVSDPDSLENQKILQQMVFKALNSAPLQAPYANQKSLDQ